MTHTGETWNRGVLFARAYIDSHLIALKQGKQLHLLETAKEWFMKADKSSLESYVDTFVGPMLDVLGFARSELQGNVLVLYEDRSRRKVVSLCHVVDSNQSLDQTMKGIDLAEVLRVRNPMEMNLFADFFSVQAFLSYERGKCRLDVNKRESDDATKQIEEHLQGKIEDILGKICMGFIQSDDKKSYTDEEKNAVFSNSIYLLYRILFILYAEARGLLPLQDPEYYKKSMEKLINIAEKDHRRGIENPNGREMWNTLRELFSWISQGNRTLGIPPYNGGLFEDGDKRYLANHAINNAYLSEALFSLGFREEKGNVIPINYDDLSVRHLGGLYEGILEYNLFIAPERMVRRKQKQVYRFILGSEAGTIKRTDTVIEKGEVYFSQSKEERKLTGSYYTPEDIVQYIVENSLGQYLVDVDKELTALVHKHMEAHRTAVDDKERRSVERFIDKEILSFLEKRVLTIKVLDPATGSGHFLVNASHFLTNYIVESLCSTGWENDLVDTSPIYWRRRVVEKCVFGVDLNELATELAKLSLWLISADNKKPLSFLDHHFRTRNSLLGVDLDDLGELPNFGKENDSGSAFQTTLYYSVLRKEFIPKVLQAFKEMEVPSEDIEDVERKKGKLKEWEGLKRGLQRVADTWLASLFDYQIGADKYQSLLYRAVEGKDVSVDDTVKKIANASRNSFLHWWLEFPEVFFRSAKNTNEGGFDVVIGNPPYGNILRDQEKKALFDFRTKTTNEVAANFLERALMITRKNGYVGFVVANSIATNRRTSSVRNLIRENMSTSNMALFGIRPAKLFPDADIRVLIFFGKKDQPENPGAIFTTNLVRFTREQRHSLFENLSFESTEGLVLGKEKIGDGIEDASLPKVGHSTARNILLKLKEKSNVVFGDLMNRPGFEEKMEFRKTGRYWLNALDKIPYESTKIEAVMFKTQIERDFCVLVINSSLFYLYWSTYGNSRDFPLSLLKKFPFPAVEELKKNGDLQELKKKISNCLLESFLPRGRLGEFRTVLCRDIIDSIDDFLAKIYYLNKEEVEFIKKYDDHLRNF